MATHGKRRAYGQHFLKDQRLSASIAEYALQQAIQTSSQQILEIGPGRGALTEPLLSQLKISKTSPSLLLVEKDVKLASEWARRPQDSSFAIQCADFLELDETVWLKKRPLTVLSNLPYSAGTAILLKLAAHWAEIPVMVLMFQAEVAQRLRAEPETKAWGSLSIWIQNRWDVEKLYTVKPGAFAPPPEVESEVVCLTRRMTPRIEIPATPESEKLWESLLKACFAHRRKMLRAGLKGHSVFQNALEVSQVSGTKRAEALTWDEWSKLWRAVLNFRS